MNFCVFLLINVNNSIDSLAHVPWILSIDKVTAAESYYGQEMRRSAHGK
jgi:hypothetical protein